MTIATLLANLRERDIALWVEGDRLRYSAPKGTLTPALRSELAAQKAEIIALLRDAAITTDQTTSSLRSTSQGEGDLPLACAQQGLWLLDQLTTGYSTFNIRGAICLDGQLDVVALTRSLNEIVRRHTALRTVFKVAEGRPVQNFVPILLVPLLFGDLSALSAAQQEREIVRLAAEELRRSFNLRRGPLMCFTLWRLGPEKAVLLSSIPHIIFDGWSMDVLVRELATHYEVFATGKPSSLPVPEQQYTDYVLWQQQWLQGEAYKAQMAYWQQQLTGMPPVLELPLDYRRPSVRALQIAGHTFQLSRELTGELKAFSQREGVTLFMTLLAALQLLLYRYSGQEDIVVGTTVAGRTQAEFESLIGCTVNALVLRTNLAGNPTFRELLKRVREVALEAYTHQELPFERLVNVMVPKRNQSYAPLVQVKLVFQNAMMPVLEAAGLAICPLERARVVELLDGSISLVEDITLSVLEADAQLSMLLAYDSALFKETTISRMMEQWRHLLESVIAQPEQPISSASFPTEEERQRMLIAWNSTASAYPRDTCIHHLLERQAECIPDAVAVSFEDEQFTYRELNQQANQVAHHLQKLGVGPEQRVGISLERSFEMIVGILAILKAGGAFVPLDPAYPQERLTFMVHDAQASVLLTQERLLARFAEHRGKALCLHRDWQSISQANRENPRSEQDRVSAENLAYVIYTSGSTGKPKGVLLCHRGLCNLTKAQIGIFDVKPTSRVLQFASLSFDASVSEIFITLLAGATLCLAAQDTLLPGSSLIKLLREQAVTLMTVPPSLLAALPTTALPTLQTLIVAGEACSAEVVADWAENHRFFNAYGPTEATVCATFAECAVGSHSPTIGRPIANTEIYLLDAHLHPVPIGVSGELHIGGAGLARGYFNRPELTAERFIPHPFSTDAGARLYKTGDLARYQPDGVIEYVGRIDRQVKLRGFRIELEEIETALCRHPDVQQSAVVLQANAAGDKHLVAYVVPGQKQGATNSDRAELWPSVAEYFIYDDLLYFAMTNDVRRNNSYRAAINQTVKDKIVLDIGTGKDAILARFCVEGGAKRVYAIEILEESYLQASACIQRLALEEKIILIHADSTRVHLPEKVDVCVSEIVGSIGGSEGAVCLMNDARRFLKESGTMIPQRSITKIAAVCLPSEIATDPGFTAQTGYYAEKIFEQVGYPFDLRLCIKNVSSKDLISSADIFEDLDFTSYIEPAYSREVTLTVNKRSKMDGFLLWLNLHTVEGEEIDILEHEHCWLPIYMPVFYPGIEVCEGDVIKAACNGMLSDNELNPDYSLEGRIIRENGKTIHFHYDSFHHKQSYKQTTFYELLFSPDSVKVQKEKLSSVLTIDELQSFSKNWLPAYMVPATFVVLDSLPLTPNGKIDRHMLSQRGIESYGSTAYVVPQTNAEQLIADIWQEVLNLERVGIDDNFFDLGGHSLLFATVQNELQKIFHRDISVVDLFTHTTIKSLASYISQQPGEEVTIPQSNDHLNQRRSSTQRQRAIRQHIAVATQQGAQDE